jgi:RNA polymerase sigma-70 factor (ECF subfamily)
MNPSGQSPATNTLEPALWVDRYGDSLWRFAMSRLHDQQAAEELIQETFASALSAKDRFAGASSELTWLTGILNHKILDHIRRLQLQRARGTQSLDDHAAASVAGHDPHASTFASDGHWAKMPGPISDRTDPDDRLVEDLSDCKQKLPESLAQPFIMREVQGMDGPTICKVLGLTPTNLWTRLHRARASLRDCLEHKWASRPSKRSA